MILLYNGIVIGRLMDGIRINQEILRLGRNIILTQKLHYHKVIRLHDNGLHGEIVTSNFNEPIGVLDIR